MENKSFLSPSGITPIGRKAHPTGEDIKANLHPAILKKIREEREQNKIDEKVNWENKQNSMKKREMYVPTSIPGQVRLVEID